jgi:hypothetical protein
MRVGFESGIATSPGQPQNYTMVPTTYWARRWILWKHKAKKKELYLEDSTYDG